MPASQMIPNGFTGWPLFLHRPLRFSPFIPTFSAHLSFPSRSFLLFTCELLTQFPPSCQSSKEGCWNTAGKYSELFLYMSNANQLHTRPMHKGFMECLSCIVGCSWGDVFGGGLICFINQTMYISPNLEGSGWAEILLISCRVVWWGSIKYHLEPYIRSELAEKPAFATHQIPKSQRKMLVDLYIHAQCQVVLLTLKCRSYIHPYRTEQ